MIIDAAACEGAGATSDGKACSLAWAVRQRTQGGKRPSPELASEKGAAVVGGLGTRTTALDVFDCHGAGRWWSCLCQGGRAAARGTPHTAPTEALGSRVGPSVRG
jgi:hypothetical protein